jgi:hypothetical protein
MFIPSAGVADTATGSEAKAASDAAAGIAWPSGRAKKKSVTDSLDQRYHRSMASHSHRHKAPK